MSVDRALCSSKRFFVHSVSYSHDIDVIELGSSLAPIAVGEYFVTPNFAAPPFRARAGLPNGTGVERVTRVPVWLGLTCSRKVEKRPTSLRAKDSAIEKNSPEMPDSANAQRSRRALNFLRRKLPLQGRQHAPLAVGESDGLDNLHFGRFRRLIARTNRFASHMADARERRFPLPASADNTRRPCTESRFDNAHRASNPRAPQGRPAWPRPEFWRRWSE